MFSHTKQKVDGNAKSHDLKKDISDRFHLYFEFQKNLPVSNRHLKLSRMIHGNTFTTQLMHKEGGMSCKVPSPFQMTHITHYTLTPQHIHFCFCVSSS